MIKALSLSDVLLVPANISTIDSRKDVDTATRIAKGYYHIPLVSSNMDTVYSPRLATEIAKVGAASCVHRFCSIEDNIKLFQAGWYGDPFTRLLKPWVSVGITEGELERAESLLVSGAETIVVDVANAASMKTIRFYDELNKIVKGNAGIIVGNFAHHSQYYAFQHHVDNKPMTIKVGVGNGSACETRIVTGVGYPMFSALESFKGSGVEVICDGGGQDIADVPKALALGARMVMMGRHFAACVESGGKKYYHSELGTSGYPTHTLYRGSASSSSYKDQGKEAEHRPSEGAEMLIPVTGSVSELLQKYQAAIRSSMSYLDARDLNEFQENAEFIEITNAGQIEGKAFAKK